MTGSTRPDTRSAERVRPAPVAGPRAVGSASRWQVLGPVAAAVVGSIVAWGTYYDKPLGNDEGGYLMVARQWSPGSSLYGNYWVDRPPLLIELFSLAGGPLGLRLIGLCAVLTSVLLAARVGRLVTPGYGRAPAWTAVTAAAFLSSPPRTNGTASISPLTSCVPNSGLERKAAAVHAVHAGARA